MKFSTKFLVLVNSKQLNILYSIDNNYFDLQLFKKQYTHVSYYIICNILK